MDALRAVGDWLAGRPGPALHRIPLDDLPATGDPGWPDRARLMRRCGEDCHVRDHHDALRQLGHTLDDLRRVENEYNHLWDLHRAVTEERDRWRARARTAEAMLRHPCTSERDVA